MVSHCSHKVLQFINNAQLHAGERGRGRGRERGGWAIASVHLIKND